MKTSVREMMKLGIKKGLADLHGTTATAGSKLSDASFFSLAFLVLPLLFGFGERL